MYKLKPQILLIQNNNIKIPAYLFLEGAELI